MLKVDVRFRSQSSKHPCFPQQPQFWHSPSRLRIPRTSLLAGVVTTRDHCRKETPSPEIQLLASPSSSSKDDLDLGLLALCTEVKVPTVPPTQRCGGKLRDGETMLGRLLSADVLHAFSTLIKALCMRKHCSPHFTHNHLGFTIGLIFRLQLKATRACIILRKNAPLRFKDTASCCGKLDLH